MRGDARAAAQVPTQPEMPAIRPPATSGVALEERVTADLDRDERYERATSEPQADAALPAATVAEFVEALIRLGFNREQGGASGCVVLTRGTRAIALPLLDDGTILEPALTWRLLAVATVHPSAFLDAIIAVRRTRPPSSRRILIAR
jgi:hypothetical protein